RSFQAETSLRTPASYSTAARAEANAIRRPEHSRQRATGQATGAPQRAHSGARSRGKARAQVAQRVDPGTEQTTQRLGKSRSSSTCGHARAEAVPCLCQKCDNCVTSRHGNAATSAAAAETVPLGGERPGSPRPELVGTMGRPQASAARPAPGAEA